MRRIPLVLLVLVLIPASVFAARAPSSFSTAESLRSVSSSPGNAYAAGASMVLTTPVAGDLTALGGSVVAAAPVGGDSLLLGGSISSRAPVAGDFRAIGGSILVREPVAGDFTALGLSVTEKGEVGGSVFVVALNTTLSGAEGPVIVYGNNVALSGEYGGDVKVFGTGRLSIDPDTRISGELSYETPEEAAIPATAAIDGGVIYTRAAYLPDFGDSRLLVLIGIGFFLFVRILGALLIAGLLAGLFPQLAEALVARTYPARMRTILLSLLLGFAIFVATPVLLVILALTFVGIGLALLLGVVYAFLVIVSLAYAGILAGSLFARRFLGREAVLWHDGVLGMLALSLLTLVPIIGPLFVCLVAAYCAGSLLILFFQFAFPREREGETVEML